MAGHYVEFGGEIAWPSTPGYQDQSRFTASINSHKLADYDASARRSIGDSPVSLWGAAFDDLAIELYEPHHLVLDTLCGIACSCWCVSGTLNSSLIRASDSALP